MRSDIEFMEPPSIGYKKGVNTLRVADLALRPGEWAVVPGNAKGCEGRAQCLKKTAYRLGYMVETTTRRMDGKRALFARVTGLLKDDSK